MTEKKQAVRNAADPEQVRKAGDKDLFRRENELKDLQVLLAIPEGKRFIWRMLGRCRTFESIMAPDTHIYYNSGAQDVGHFLLAEITEADPNALIEMMKTKNKENT